jgi:hypothetical protein
MHGKYNILLQNPEKKRQLVKTRCRCEIIIKIKFKENWFENVNLIYMVQIP